MRRTGFLYEKLTDERLLNQAIDEARKDKSLRKRKDIAEVVANRETYVSKAAELLRSGLYFPAKPSVKTIREKYSGKEREISMIPFFPDAVIQAAIVLLLRPLILKRMDPNSCAHVVGRGQTKVLHRIRSVLKKEWRASHPKDGSRGRRSGAKYWLYLDVRHFYQSIDRKILEAKLRRIVKDERFIEMIMRCANVAEEGIVIGTNLSVWLSTLYLEEADRIAHENGVRYLVHFADDIVLLSGNRRKLIKTKAKLDSFLASISLSAKPNWQCRSFEDMPLTMLQYKFHANGKVELKKPVWKNVRRTMLRYPDSRRDETVVSYCGMMAKTDCDKAFSKYDMARKKAIAVSRISERAKKDLTVARI